MEPIIKSINVRNEDFVYVDIDVHYNNHSETIVIEFEDLASLVKVLQADEYINHWRDLMIEEDNDCPNCGGNSGGGICTKCYTDY